MLSKRIIPCLDVTNGRVVKGVNFVNLIDAGDPVEIAKFYNQSMADEIVFLDITASSNGTSTMIDVVKKTAEEIFIPLTVGGGIRTLEDIRNILNAGADKISINSYAVKNPDFINEASKKFGSQCVVVAIDAKKRENDDGYDVYLNGGRVNTGIDVVKWAIEVEKRGAGEILLTSMDSDGAKNGYDNELNRLVTSNVNIPVIASGGAGKLSDFKDAVTDGNVDAMLCASLFHFKELSVEEVKEYLKSENIPVRL